MINKLTENLLIYSETLQANSKLLHEKIISLDLKTLLILIENCPNTVNDNLKTILESLIKINNSDNINIRNFLGKCWNSLLNINKNFFFASELFEALIAFFIDSFILQNYELNFTSAEFFSFVLDKEEKLIYNSAVAMAIEAKLDL